MSVTVTNRYIHWRYHKIFPPAGQNLYTFTGIKACDKHTTALARSGRRRELVYLGVVTTCGTPTGGSNVVVPLPLFMRKPRPPEPGRVLAAIGPILPLTISDPRGPAKKLPNFGACDPLRAPN